MFTPEMVSRAFRSCNVFKVVGTDRMVQSGADLLSYRVTIIIRILHVSVYTHTMHTSSMWQDAKAIYICRNRVRKTIHYQNLRYRLV